MMFCTDNEGVAVILCDTEQQRKYKAFISGQTLLESCLHHNLAEHLNSEIGLGTITDLSSAKGNSYFAFLIHLSHPYLNAPAQNGYTILFCFTGSRKIHAITH